MQRLNQLLDGLFLGVLSLAWWDFLANVLGGVVSGVMCSICGSSLSLGLMLLVANLVYGIVVAGSCARYSTVFVSLVFTFVGSPGDGSWRRSDVCGVARCSNLVDFGT